MERAIYEELLRLPENRIGEIVNGRLHASRLLAPRATRTGSSLSFHLIAHYDHPQPDGWWILKKPEIHLGEHVLVPDIAGWRRERMPALPETAWFELPPDWVCEILSPGTARIDRVEKLPIYAGAGVRHCWLVDPDLRTLEAFENREGKWLLLDAFENDDRVRIAPFEAADLELATLWAD